MTLNKTTESICITCNSMETCTRKVSYKPPVIYCEEFDGTSERKRGVTADLPGEKREHLDLLMGLCCNCAEKDRCKLSGTPGGIWHCEEYN